MRDEQRALPVAIARLVQAQRVDIEGELRALLEEGTRRVTIGIGPTVDIPLLDEELHAAEIAELDRELVVATVMAEPDGYIVERGWSNFGLYTWSDADPIWHSVPWMGIVRGLRPGDKVAMGSTPAEAPSSCCPESALDPAADPPAQPAQGGRGQAEGTRGRPRSTGARCARRRERYAVPCRAARARALPRCGSTPIATRRGSTWRSATGATP
ncbi:MAG: hypothetical protein R3F59_21935 [Myxococcota bacterium]